MNCSEERSFRGTSSNNGLRLDTVGDGSTRHNKRITSSRVFVAQVIGMRCINDGEEFRKPNIGRVGREVIRVKMGRDRVNRNMGQ
jgi:hypothetical protein